MYVYIVVSTIILYAVLQFMDDRRNVALNKAPSTLGTKIAIFVFTAIITTTVFYLFWDSGSPAPHESELKYINQEIETGFPKF